MKYSQPYETADRETRDSVSRLLTGVDRSELSRRQFLARATALGISLSSVGMLLAACGKEAVKAEAPPAMSQDLPKQLLIYNWSGYMAPDVLKSFEKKYGVKCIQKIYNSNEEMYEKIAGGAVYDVIFPSDAWVAHLSGNQLLRPLDMSLLPNFSNVLQPTFIKPSFDNESDGHKYSIPYMFGTTGFCANLEKVPDPGTGWSILWDPKYKQQIAMLNTAQDVVGEALMTLGYSPYSTDPAQIDEAAAKLIGQKPLVSNYSHSPDINITAGEALVNCWDGNVITALQQGVKPGSLRYILPAEGYRAWADGVCIPSTSPSPYAAHLFLDYLMDPKIAGESAVYSGYQPVVDEAMLYVKDAIQQHMRPSVDVISAGLIAADVGGANKLFEAAWRRVRSA